MATVTVSYNGQALPTQVRKLSYSRSERELSFSSVHAMPPANYSAIAESVRASNKVLVIGGGAYAETFDLNSGSATPYTNMQTNIEKLGERTDGNGMVLVRFSARARLQTKIDSGFRTYDIDWTEDEQGVYTLTISGEVTSKGATSASDNFSAGIGAVETIAKALLGDGSDGDLTNTLFDVPQTVIRIDRNNGDLTFTRSYRELAFPANLYDPGEAESADRLKRDNTIIFPIWAVGRTKPLRRGKEEPHIITYQVRWSARLNKSKGDASFIAQYDGTIRALIIKKIKEIFSESDTLVLEADVIDYGRSGQVASGTWEVSGPESLVRYSETLSALVVVADSDKVLDGEDFTEAAYSSGARMEITQRVLHVQRYTPPTAPAAPVVAFSGQPVIAFLKEMNPEESSEIVGGESGAATDEGEDANETGSATEYTLNWRATYKAYAKPGPDDFKETVAGGEKMNIVGKIIKPNG